MKPTQIRIVTQKPTAHDLGRTDVGWFTVSDNMVSLCNELGKPVPGEWSRELQPGQDPAVVARYLLREHFASRATSFDRALSYPPAGIV